MANKIKIKRGLSSNINKLQLEAGELAITTDTTELYAGDKNNNAVKINNNTTYTLTKNGSTITLTGSDGKTSTVTDANTTYSNAGLGNGYGTCSTAATTATKTVTLSGYALSTQGRVSVKFDEDVPAAATLNINSKGAKAIYYKGAAITDNIILGGDIVTFVYNGTQYEIVNIHRENNGQELVAGQHVSIVDNVITVNDLGDLGQLKTTKKDFIVNAINNLVDEDAIIRDEVAASTLNLNNSVESLNTRVSILESDVETSVDKLANTLMTINETNGIDVGTEINTLQTKIDGNQVNIYSGDTNYLQIAPDTSTGEVKTKCEKFQTKQILCGYHERKEMLIGTEKRTGFFYVEGGSN